MGHGLPSSSGPGRAHSSQSSQSRPGETHVPLLKNEIHTHHMQKETASHPKKTSKSAHFITYSITEGGHLEKTLTWTLSAVILQLLLRVLPPRRFNFNPRPTRQKSEDWCLETDSKNRKHWTSKSEKRLLARICGCILVLSSQGWATSQKRENHYFKIENRNAAWVPSQNAPYTSNELSQDLDPRWFKAS